jgi:hypothetical protein
MIKLTYKLLTLSFLLAVGGVVFNHSSASAQQVGSNFVANRIIDDSLFYNGNEMTASQIQQFLNARIPVCDTYGTKMHSSGQTRAQYGASVGNPAPYTCLKDYVAASTPAKSDSSLCGAMPSYSNRSAAQIVDDVARACNISQKVLLVTLQKEQSLLTDDWPWPVQYEKAMGYYCPDDPTRPGWCAPEFAGFFNQVYNAARQLQRYRQSPTSFNHALGRTSYVAFQANAPSCGGTNLTMQTAATAALYNYTPYQPNQAALNKLYGTGDSCSAYGNRNFWRMFNDWFGSTYAVSSSWTYLSQEMHSDGLRTKNINPGVISPNTTYYMRIKAMNSGPAPWLKNQVNLATNNSQDRNSAFCDSSWLSCNRAATIKEASVAPGEIGTFEFSIRTPSTLGNYNEYFRPVVEGVTWMNDIGMHWKLSIKNPTSGWSLASQSVFSDASRERAVEPTLIASNTQYYIRIAALNTGNTVWSSSGAPVNLATNNSQDRNSAFCDSSWLSCNRAATIKEASVAPGEIGTFEFSIRTPSTLGNYNEYFRPVVEGVTWMNDIGMHLPLQVKPPVYDWQYVSQATYTNDSKTTLLNSATVSGGSRVYNVIRARNTGNTSWSNTGPNSIRLGTNNSQDRNSAFCDSSWLSCNRAATIKEASVAPGEIGTFEFWVKIPYALNGTEFKEFFRPVIDGTTWLQDNGLHFSYSMSSTEYEYSYIGQSSFSDINRSVLVNLLAATPNTTYYLQVNLRNTGGTAWTNTGSNPMRLGTSSPTDRTSIFCDSSWLACNRPARTNEASVAPGDVGTFDFSIKTPSTGSGTFNEYFRPVIEGRQWLTDIGMFYRINY